MTDTEWKLERALKALELAVSVIAEDCGLCPVHTKGKSCDSYHKGGCKTVIVKYFLRQTRGMKK